jgi:hypothetical protein
MGDTRCRRYFVEPTRPYQRQYEALRAFFVERQNTVEIAARFGYRIASIRSMISRFRRCCQRGEIPPFLRSLYEAEGPAQATPRMPLGPKPRR